MVSHINHGVGRPRINDEQMMARFRKGTLERIQGVLNDREKKSDFVRTAVEREIERRQSEKQ